MTCHYSDLGSASDWLELSSNNQNNYQDMGSDTSSVWNFCPRYSDVVLRGLKWRPRETSAVFSGNNRALSLLITTKLPAHIPLEKRE